VPTTLLETKRHPLTTAECLSSEYTVPATPPEAFSLKEFCTNVLLTRRRAPALACNALPEVENHPSWSGRLTERKFFEKKYSR
jgi:hypothetical protein